MNVEPSSLQRNKLNGPAGLSLEQSRTTPRNNRVVDNGLMADILSMRDAEKSSDSEGDLAKPKKDLNSLLMAGTDKPFNGEFKKENGPTKANQNKKAAVSSGGGGLRPQTESIRGARAGEMRQSRPLNDDMLKAGYFDASIGGDDDIFAHLDKDKEDGGKDMVREPTFSLVDEPKDIKPKVEKPKTEKAKENLTVLTKKPSSNFDVVSSPKNTSTKEGVEKFESALKKQMTNDLKQI